MLRTRLPSAATAALLALGISLAGAAAAASADEPDEPGTGGFIAEPMPFDDELEVAPHDDAPTETEPASDCVVVVWQMPGWVDQWNPTWPQTFVSVHDSDCAATQIDAGLFPVPDACDTQYQLDKYFASEKTTALIAGGVLQGYGPEEDLVPGTWGTLVKNPECTDLSGGVVVVPLVTEVDRCDGRGANAIRVATFTVIDSENVSYRYAVNGGAPIGISFDDGDTEVTIAVDPLDAVDVTAAPAAGFALPAGYEPWTYVFIASAFCPDTLPATSAEADLSPADCETHPVRVTVSNEQGVIWRLNGVVVDGNATHRLHAGAAVHLTAELAGPTEENSGGWAWSDPEQQTVWRADAAAEGACTATLGSLAATGPAVGPALLGAAGAMSLLIGIGIGIGLVTRRRAFSQ